MPKHRPRRAEGSEGARSCDQAPDRSPQQVVHDLAEVAIEEEPRMRPVLGEQRPATFDELIVREVVVALRVDLERGQQATAIEEDSLPSISVSVYGRPVSWATNV